MTLDRHDQLLLDPQPVTSPAAPLTVADDARMTRLLRVGRPDAFGDAPIDPNGAIQLGRNLTTAQPMSLARLFKVGNESFRLGTTTDGCGFVSDGAHDVPLLTFRPSRPGRNPDGRWGFHKAVLSYDQGTVRGEHPTSKRVSAIVPK